MFIDTELVNQAMAVLDEAFGKFYPESVPEGMSGWMAQYVFYQEALRIIRQNPIENELTQRALELRIELRLQRARLMGDLNITTATV